MTESIQPPQFALEGTITLDITGPVNTTGAFCDLFTGTHPIAGKVALKRPRGASYTDALNEGKRFQRLRLYLRTGLVGGSRVQISSGANVAATPKRKAEDVDDSILRAPKRHRLCVSQGFRPLRLGLL